MAARFASDVFVYLRHYEQSPHLSVHDNFLHRKVSMNSSFRALEESSRKIPVAFSNHLGVLNFFTEW